jgi:hypothetical protein
LRRAIQNYVRQHPKFEAGLKEQGGEVPLSIPRARRAHLGRSGQLTGGEGGSSPAQFDVVRTRLFVKGSNLSNPDTGMYCLSAVDRTAF